MTTTQRLAKAIKQYRLKATECYEHEAVSSFIALYNTIGETELYDGIATAMQDEGFEETYEDIIYEYEELNNDGI